MLGNLPIDRYVKLQLMFEQVESHMRKQLDELPCKFDPTPSITLRKLGARFCEEPDVDIFDDEEIKRAIIQEICHELILMGLQKIYQDVDQYTLLGDYDQYDERTDLYSPTGAGIYPKLKTAFEKAVLLHGYQPWAIVSPTVLTAFQSHMLMLDTNSDHVYSPMKYLGSHLGVRVYVNQYAHDSTPVIFGGRESLTYQCDSFVEYGGGGLDPTTFEHTHRFMTRFTINPNPTKLYAMKVKFARLACFL